MGSRTHTAMPSSATWRVDQDPSHGVFHRALHIINIGHVPLEWFPTMIPVYVDLKTFMGICIHCLKLCNLELCKLAAFLFTKSAGATRHIDRQPSAAITW